MEIVQRGSEGDHVLDRLGSVRGSVIQKYLGSPGVDLVSRPKESQGFPKVRHTTRALRSKSTPWVNMACLGRTHP